MKAGMKSVQAVRGKKRAVESPAEEVEAPPDYHGRHWKDIEADVLASFKPKDQRWVRSHVDLTPDNDVLAMTRLQLIKRFPGKPLKSKLDSPRLQKLVRHLAVANDMRLIHTFVWQSWLKLKTGEMKPIDGNIRSFWYREYEPFVVAKGLIYSDIGPPVEEGALRSIVETAERLGLDVLPMLLDNHAARENYFLDAISQGFGGFVRKGIFRFQDDFRFRDPRQQFRKIGQSRPRIVLFTEKEGLWHRICLWAAKEFGITVIASHGEPGLLAMEYLVDALKAKRVASIYLGVLTDYDPWGYNIAIQFMKKLEEEVFFGKGKVELTALTQLNKLFTPTQIAAGKRDLTKYGKSKQSQVDEWFRQFGGIDGQKYGIHVDLADDEKLRKAVTEWVKAAK